MLDDATHAACRRHAVYLLLIFDAVVAAACYAVARYADAARRAFVTRAAHAPERAERLC